MLPSVLSTRRAWIEFLSAQAFTHAVTLKPNNKRCRATDGFLRDAFKRFHRDVDQALLGPRFNAPGKRHLRSFATGIIEGLPTTGHIHAAFRVAENRWEEFERMFQPLTAEINLKPTRANPWEARIIGGTSVVERITDAPGWHRYCTKNFSDIECSDRVIFLPFDA